MEILMTDREQFVVGLLAGVWNEFMKLPVEHPMEQQEFCSAINACQDKVLARAGRRAINSEQQEG